MYKSRYRIEINLRSGLTTEYLSKTTQHLKADGPENRRSIRHQPFDIWIRLQVRTIIESKVRAAVVQSKRKTKLPI